MKGDFKLRITRKQLQDLNGVLNYYIDENEKPEEFEDFRKEMKSEIKRLRFLRRKVQRLLK